MKPAATMISVERSCRDGRIDVRGFISLCAEIGAEGVDLLEYFWKDKPREVAEAPKWIADAGLTLSAFAIGNRFTTREGAEFQKQVDYCRTGVETAAKLGADKMRIFGGHIPEGSDMTREEGLTFVEKGIEAVLDFAAQHRIALALENHGDMPGRSEEVLRIVNRFDSPFLRAMPDFGNFISNGCAVKEDPVTAARALSDCMIHAHVKDQADWAERPGLVKPCILGEGKIPFAEIFRVLSDAGYEGYLSLEYEGRDAASDIEGTRRSMANLKRLLAGAAG